MGPSPPGRNRLQQDWTADRLRLRGILQRDSMQRISQCALVCIHQPRKGNCRSIAAGVQRESPSRGARRGTARRICVPLRGSRRSGGQPSCRRLTTRPALNSGTARPEAWSSKFWAEHPCASHRWHSNAKQPVFSCFSEIVLFANSMLAHWGNVPKCRSKKKTRSD